MYEPYSILGVIFGGIAGCLATALIVKLMKRVPFSTVAGNWRKHIWSIFFVAPVPAIASVSTMGVSTVLALLWLWLAPSVASKAYFGPKNAGFGTLLIFHAPFAIVAFSVWLLVAHVPLMTGG